MANSIPLARAWRAQAMLRRNIGWVDLLRPPAAHRPPEIVQRSRLPPGRRMLPFHCQC